MLKRLLKAKSCHQSSLDVNNNNNNRKLKKSSNVFEKLLGYILDFYFNKINFFLLNKGTQTGCIECKQSAASQFVPKQQQRRCDHWSPA